MEGEQEADLKEENVGKTDMEAGIQGEGLNQGEKRGKGGGVEDGGRERG